MLDLLKNYGWDKLKSLPHQLQHLTSLTELHIEILDGSFSRLDKQPFLSSEALYLLLWERKVST
jgi:hypothetical protein